MKPVAPGNINHTITTIECCITCNLNFSGPRKGATSIVVFDTGARKFVREIGLPFTHEQVRLFMQLFV